MTSEHRHESDNVIKPWEEGSPGWSERVVSGSERNVVKSDGKTLKRAGNEMLSHFSTRCLCLISDGFTEVCERLN